MSSKTKQLYTQGELDLISKRVSEYPSNIRYALEVAAQDLGRSVGSVASTYYAKVRHLNTSISVVSTTGVMTMSNQKNAIRRNLNTLTEDDEYDIVIQLLKKMSRTRKKQVISTLFDLK